MGALCSGPIESDEEIRPRGGHRTAAGKARAEARRKESEERYVQLESLNGEENPEETIELLRRRSQWFEKQNSELKRNLQVATSRSSALEAEVLVKEAQLSLHGQPVTEGRGMTVEKWSSVLKDFKYSLDYIESLHNVLIEEFGDKAGEFVDAAKAQLIK